MTKRKASVALEDSQGSQDPEIGPRGVGVIANGSRGPRLTGSDNGNDGRSSTNQLLLQNGSSMLDNRTSKIQSGNNQNDNSNGSSINNSTNTSNTSGGTNQSHNKSKKERADNWSSTEIQLLHRGIESRRDIFYGPPSQATKKNRELAWEAITKEVNAVSTTPRTLSQVMKKYKNEKCRAKRKFIDPAKDGHNSSQLVGSSNNNLSNSNTNSNNETASGNDNLRAQQPPTNHGSTVNNQQRQQLQSHQTHLMASTASAGSSGETLSAPSATSINVVKLAPQNVAKTMIDLPGHVQHTIQMPNDDMVLIVPPDMDGLLSGVNIVSDGNGHHHFQKCPSTTLGNHQHSHHNQHAVPTLNTNQNLMNGSMGNGMMARTIPAGSMCSLVYSTGNEVCGPEHHNATSQSSLASNPIAVGAQNLVHHRGSNLDTGPQQHHLHHAAQSLHQHHQQQHSQPQQHPQQQHPHQLHQPSHHHHQQHQQQPAQGAHPQSHPIHHQHLAHNHLPPPSASTSGPGNTNNLSGVAVESQLKNLLFNLLLKDGQHSSVPNTINLSQDYSKQRNDMLAIIASSLTKIESHLSKISKVASQLLNSNTSLNESHQLAGQALQLVNASASGSTATDANPESGNGGLTIASDDNNNNSFNISTASTNIAPSQGND